MTSIYVTRVRLCKEADLLWELGESKDEGMMDDVSPMPLVQGTVVMAGEFPLEILQAKLPNLTQVMFGCEIEEDYYDTSQEYLAEFCGAFPRLAKLYVTPKIYELEPILINAISSLQHLRDFTITEDINDDDIHTIALKLPNLECLSFEPSESETDMDYWDSDDDVEIYHKPISSQAFRSIAQMSALRLLTVDIQNVVEHVNIITSTGNFSMLEELTYYDNNINDTPQAIQTFEAGLKIAKVRPELKVRAR